MNKSESFVVIKYLSYQKMSSRHCKHVIYLNNIPYHHITVHSLFLNLDDNVQKNLLFFCLCLGFSSYSFSLSLKLEKLSLVEGLYGEFLEDLPLSYLLSLFLRVLDCWISSSISWVIFCFGDYLLYCMVFLESLIKAFCCLVVKRSYLFMWCEKSTFVWFSYTGYCRMIILYIRRNVNLSRRIIHHGY